MATQPSDYQDRVLHFIEKQSEEFTVRQVATETNVKPGTVAGILSRFEDMELVVRIRMHPEQCFVMAPGAAGLPMTKIEQLKHHAALMARLRQAELRRNNRYVSRRKAGIV